MSINWYPGHMHKAQKQIKETLPTVDLIIEVLDARIPWSSENPAIAKLRGDKPCIKLLSKVDLADPVITAEWQAYLEKEKGVKTLAITTEQPARIQQIPNLCRKFFPSRDTSVKPIHTMIMGIPNVGKSTLINQLAGRMIAKTGNEPAVTKGQQRINLGNGIVLSDTPGILWPKVESRYSSYRLATTGAIKDTAMDYGDVAYFAADFLIKAYPDLLRKRYGLTDIPETELELLELIGRKRGCLAGGGRVDLNKVSEIFLHDYRAGSIGQITLETPAMIAHESIEVAAETAAREAKKAARKQRKKGSREPRPENRNEDSSSE